MRSQGKEYPKYRKHRATGQAIVTLNGRDFYLGPWGTKVSHSEYDRLIMEWLSNGKRTASETESVTVVEIILAYMRYALKHYQKDGKATSSHAGLKSALRLLKRLYGRIPAAEFGPKRLKALRLKMQDDQDDPDAKSKRLSRQMAAVNPFQGLVQVVDCCGDVSVLKIFCGGLEEITKRILVSTSGNLSWQ